MSSADVMADAPAPSHEMCGLTREDLHAMLYYMQLTRSMDDRVRSLYLQGHVSGAVYSSRGQEATAVGSAYALGPQDFVAPLIRDLGASFVRGMEPGRVFAQWLGRTGGPSAGKDGNLHFGDLSKGILAPISMLGATIPLCAGISLAGVQTGDSRVALAYIGDGGSNTGDFHEGLNFAAALRLPLIVIVEDNGFAYSTPVSQHVAIQNFADRAIAYGIPSATVDGNNVIDVFRSVKDAVQRARSGEGPTLIAAKTFRMRGHAEHDDASYVPKELIDAWAVRDPIDLLTTYMRERHLIDDETLAALASRIQHELDSGLDWAQNSPLPSPEIQAEGVYASRIESR